MTNRTTLHFFLILLGIAGAGGCSRNQFDDVYARPESLAPPIYQQLQNKGRFTNMLALIDKSGYQKTLGSAGYWTLFAPNDDAFGRYFQKNALPQSVSVKSQGRTIGFIWRDRRKSPHIFMYIYTYIYIHIYYIYTYIYASICIYTHMCMYIST